MNTQTEKKTGKSFQIKNLSTYETPKRFINIGNAVCRSSSEAMTAIAYGDNNNVNIPFRSLDFNTKCDNYHDFAACIKLIDSYNEFDADTILKAIPFVLNLQHYLNEDNPNNGSSLFNFWIGREGSPAFYVGWNEYFGDKKITDWETVEASEGQPAGKWLYWEEYTADQFKENMELLAASIGADEFSIEEDYTYSNGKKSFKARFWFD